MIDKAGFMLRAVAVARPAHNEPPVDPDHRSTARSRRVHGVRMQPDITLVLGGARSGKSRHAEALITASPPPWLYIATAQALDDEMRDRIAAHRARRIPGWQTVEAPLHLARALTTDRPALVDCLTLWLSNLLLNSQDLDSAATGLEAALAARVAPTVLVGNEVGLGIVPDNPLARRFRDAAGMLHQRLAARATRVVLTVAGLPLSVK